MFLALFAASTVSAQSLAEVAKKEKERRKKLHSSASHSYTEADLKNPEGPMTQVSGQTSTAASENETTASGESASGAAGETSGADSEATEQEDPRKTEAYWRGRLSTVDKRIQDLEAKLNSPAMTSNPRGARERQTTEQQLAQARADRQAIVNEARAAGAPPGWLR